jgi:hypothetical protein
VQRVALSHQLLEGPQEFALRRAMELAGLILVAVARLDALVQQTSYSRGEVLRRCLTGAQLKSTIDAQALTEVSRVHANLNRIGGLLKLAIREGLSDPSGYNRLNLELLDSVMDVRRAVNRLAGQP